MIYWFSRIYSNAAFFQDTQQHSRSFKESQLAPTLNGREGKSTIPVRSGWNGNLLKLKIESLLGVVFKKERQGPVVLGDICWIIWILFLSTHFSQKVKGFEAVKKITQKIELESKRQFRNFSQTRAAKLFVGSDQFPLSLPCSWNMIF